MRTTLFFLAMALGSPGQALLSPPAAWNPAVHAWVPVLSIGPDGALNLTATVRWWPELAANPGIPDPRLASVSELLLAIVPGPTWDPGVLIPTAYGLALTLNPILYVNLGGPGSWLDLTNDGVLETSWSFGQIAQVWPAFPWSAQALIVHRFGAPDVAYFSAPVPVWL